MSIEATAAHIAFEDECVSAMKIFLVKQGLPWDVVDSMCNAFVLHNFMAYVDKMDYKYYFPNGLLFK